MDTLECGDGVGGEEIVLHNSYKSPCNVPISLGADTVIHLPSSFSSSSSLSSSSRRVSPKSICELPTVAAAITFYQHRMNFENFNFKCDRSLQFQLQFKWINTFFSGTVFAFGPHTLKSSHLHKRILLPKRRKKIVQFPKQWHSINKTIFLMNCFIVISSK